MREGRIVFNGTPNEIMRPDVLRSVYDMDIAIHEMNGVKLGMYYL